MGQRTDQAPADGAIDEAELQEWLDIDVERTERIFRLLTVPIWDYGFRLRAYGAEHVPDRGAFLLCPNHSSYLDPFMQARGQRRVFRFMTKSQVFEWPVVGRVVRAVGGFPVRRGKGDAFAMTLAARLLAAGQGVVVYPEGTRYRTDDELGPPRRGAARLALEMGVPVVPVATYGTKPRQARGERAFPPRLPRMTTIYGKAMDFSSLDNTPENVDRVRDEIWVEVQRLYARAREVNRLRRRPRTLDS
jgi:1-acyl-sn-glycerol-3-phosphate acyltransferase